MAALQPVFLDPEFVAFLEPTRSLEFEGLVLDLGVGEAPYDDAPRRYTPSMHGRSGFSDALIRISYERALGPGVYLLGSASVLRVQDDQIFSALQDFDFSWALIGIRISF